jgi:hypothetical protein
MTRRSREVDFAVTTVGESAPVVLLLAAVALLGATGFNGNAKQLVPTSHDLGAVTRDSSHAISNLEPGQRSGWTAHYRKASGESMSVDVLVWPNTASPSARSSFRKICGNCTTPQDYTNGTVEFGRYGRGVAAYGTCRNVIVVTTALGHRTQAQLAHDAGFAAGWVLGRAFGTRC